MGRHVDVYAGPLSEEDYRYLKMREKQFLLAENVKLFGEHPEEWKIPIPDDEVEEDEVEEDEVVHKDHTGFDDDDVEYVRSLSETDLNAELESRELPVDGDDNAKRQRLLEAIHEEHLDEDEDEELAPDGSEESGK